MAAVKFYRGLMEVFSNAGSNVDQDILYFIDSDTTTDDPDWLQNIDPDSIWVGKSMVGSRYIEDLHTRSGSVVNIHNLSCDGSIDMSQNRITHLATPQNYLDAVNKDYVDGFMYIPDVDVPVNMLDGSKREQFAYIQLAVDTVGDKHTVAGVNNELSVFNLRFGTSTPMRDNTSIRVYVYAKPVLECWWETEVGVGDPVISESSPDGTYPTDYRSYVVNGNGMNKIVIDPSFNGIGSIESNTFIGGEPTHLVPGYDGGDAPEYTAAQKEYSLIYDATEGKIGVGVIDIVFSRQLAQPQSRRVFRTLVVPVSGLTEADSRID